ncbi:MAG: DUF2703 domain-containing protein [Planctomycetota bacterium]|jgi:hypothetical protein
MRIPSTLATLVLLGCAVQRAPDDRSRAHILVIRWQRLVDENRQTCPRCRATEVELDEAVARLQRSLAPSNAQVELKKVAIDQATFDADPLSSNRIWIAGRPLEEWLEGTVGKSPCSSSCGDRECRTVCVGTDVYEAISADVIVRVGLSAAATLLQSPQRE